MTEILQDTFQCKIRSHRGGRWYLDDRIIRSLNKYGYTVDCTCTPGRSWENQPGWTPRSGGTDWTQVGSRPYRILDGKEKLMLEIPVSALSKRKESVPACFRPNGRNGNDLIVMLDLLFSESYYIEFMIHSSELMPGGSPTFRNKGQIEKLYNDLEKLFSEVRKKGTLE